MRAHDMINAGRVLSIIYFLSASAFSCDQYEILQKTHLVPSENFYVEYVRRCSVPEVSLLYCFDAWGRSRDEFNLTNSECFVCLKRSNTVCLADLLYVSRAHEVISGKKVCLLND